MAVSRVEGLGEGIIVKRLMDFNRPVAISEAVDVGGHNSFAFRALALARVEC